MGGDWTVRVSWIALGDYSEETVDHYPDWPKARYAALHLTCCAGARYVTVSDPAAVVVAEWDRYTNLWREYALAMEAPDGGE